jgi:hypothetical protein
VKAAMARQEAAVRHPVVLFENVQKNGDGMPGGTALSSTFQIYGSVYTVDFGRNISRCAPVVTQDVNDEADAGLTPYTFVLPDKRSVGVIFTNRQRTRRMSEAFHLVVAC